MNLQEWFELVRKSAMEAAKDIENKITKIEIKGVDMASGKELANTISNAAEANAKVVKDIVANIGENLDNAAKETTKVIKEVVKNISNENKPDTSTVTFDENGNVIHVEKSKPKNKKKK